MKRTAKRARPTAAHHSSPPSHANWGIRVLHVGQSDWPEGVSRVSPWREERTMEHAELWCIRGGEGIVQSRGADRPMQRGNLLLFKPGETYAVAQSPEFPLRTLFVGFEAKRKRNEFFRYAPDHTELMKDDLGEFILNQMLDLYWEAYLDFFHCGRYAEAKQVRRSFRGTHTKNTRVNPFPPNPIILHAEDLASKHPIMTSADRFFELLIEEWIRRGHHQQPHQMNGLTRRQQDVISTAAMLIHNDPGRYRNVGEAAKANHYSTDHFTRLFKKVVGLHPRQYLINSRMGKARSWLADSELSIKEISNKLGYRHPQFFTRQFKECVGQSPSEYRQSKE